MIPNVDEIVQAVEWVRQKTPEGTFIANWYPYLYADEFLRKYPYMIPDELTADWVDGDWPVPSHTSWDREKLGMIRLLWAELARCSDADLSGVLADAYLRLNGIEKPSEVSGV